MVQGDRGSKSFNKKIKCGVKGVRMFSKGKKSFSNAKSILWFLAETKTNPVYTQLH